uniref:Sdh3 n=1 Tax=Plocamiocolax pulvinatus TaxID=35206 RepID=E5Q3F8_9FLOR|nr:Sdh3 [Plocamiocolax pulvinata]ADR03241.1 Sdh3 [Plocamiocolax pulvinata]
MYNRPITPHITIYLPQISSTFSILNRVSSICTIILLLFSILIMKFISNLYSLYYSFHYIISNSIYIYIYLIVLINYVYHFFQGFLSILWSFNIFLNYNNFLINVFKKKPKSN